MVTRGRILGLVLAGCLLLAFAEGKASTQVLKNVEDFEEVVLGSDSVWLIGFIHADDAAPNVLASVAQELGERRPPYLGRNQRGRADWLRAPTTGSTPKDV